VQTAPPRAAYRVASDWFILARTLLRYALFENDTDNTHEGYNTLIQMDQAPRYNAWLGRKLRPHLGQRVLEIGAGVGTITREIAPGRERVIALEADGFYVQRLRNLFRGSTVVQPLHAPVESTDWAALARERLDSVMLSNVLEHIQDDAAAVRQFRGVLSEGSRLVILVPALMALYGSIDEAIGHFRRYTPQTLSAVLESNGFEIESLEWLNLLGIPGWFFNSRVLRRRSVPALQVRLYDRLAPLLARLEANVRLPLGMSLLVVARAVPISGVER
jgi:SAM-dependent methyltransferase